MQPQHFQEILVILGCRDEVFDKCVQVKARAGARIIHKLRLAGYTRQYMRAFLARVAAGISFEFSDTFEGAGLDRSSLPVPT